MARSSIYRFSAVLVALLYGLSWGVPVGHASCTPMEPPSPDRCETSDLRQHCKEDVGPPSAACLTHHASQGALTGGSPSIDTQGGSGGVAGTEPVVSVLQKTSSFLTLVLHAAVPRAHRLHLSAEVWLE